MTNETIIFILLNSVVSFGLSLLFYKNYLKDKSKWLLIGLRFLSFFIVITLLFDFSTELTQVSTQKPKLYIGVDDSKSINYLSDSTEVTQLIKTLEDHPELNEVFDINLLKFGSKVEVLDSLSFNQNYTNLSSLFDFYTNLKDNNAQFVTITDANQNFGQSIDYSLSQSLKNRNYGIIIGDTTQVDDLNLSRTNHNAYAFLDNNFPVEVFVENNSNSATKTNLKLLQNNQLISQQNINLSPNATGQFKFEIKAKQIGKQTYKIVVDALKNEKNIINNTKSFGIEVIDNRYNILLVSEIIHPDISALKSSISASNQYKFTFKKPQDVNDLSKYNLVIAYQPTPIFKPLLTQVKTSKQSLFIIGGTSTDYDLLTDLDFGFSKKNTSLIEDIQAEFSNSYSFYETENLKFQDYPPLKNQLSRVELTDNFQTLLDQKVNGFKDGNPLWIVKNVNNHKLSVLFGENIWMWRSKAYQSFGNFKEFDRFIDQHIQFLSNKKRRERLTVEAKNFYNRGEAGKISAKFYDANYNFKSDAKLNLTITNLKTNTVNTISMARDANQFSSSISSLPTGDYSYKITAEAFSKTGDFSIIDFNRELQDQQANYKFLASALQKEQIYLQKNNADLINSILNKKPKAIQKSFVKKLGFIEIKYLLGLLILTLGFEWILRKYRGLT
ncbi:hypothetical protein SAMN05444278_101146 [Psychroflexus salarius]|uniref:VWA domain-containing protein n=1 Tax=Psychroflexus salarius TaxID=1155689 RepID=A0A1M4SGE3_9FLAO|nr:hypothetical protein [Psychroflexus salarius]SHE31303.1 hypothetical protein SAMN05444278_101146 [Psychroflexus salarius]